MASLLLPVDAVFLRTAPSEGMITPVAVGTLAAFAGKGAATTIEATIAMIRNMFSNLLKDFPVNITPPLFHKTLLFIL